MNARGAWWILAAIIAVVVVTAVAIILGGGNGADGGGNGGNGSTAELDCSNISLSADKAQEEATLNVSGIPAELLSETTIEFECVSADGTPYSSTKVGITSHNFPFLPSGQYNCSAGVKYRTQSCAKSIPVDVPGGGTSVVESNGFTVKVEPKSKIVRLEESGIPAVGQGKTVNVTFTFTNNTGSTVYVPINPSFTDICSQGPLGSCQGGIRECPDISHIGEQHMVKNGESLHVDVIIGPIAQHSTSRNYSMSAGIQYSKRSDCIGNMMNPCSWTNVQSDSFELHVRVSSAIDQDIHYVQPDTRYEECSAAGLTGKTLAGAIPHMLFSWDWKDVKTYECDSSGGQYFCDATQFSISLFKKLETMNRYIEKGEPIPSELLSFTSFLKKDSFSDDFKEDFVDYYVNEFFGNTPDWFYSTGHWNRYFVDGSGKANNRIAFEGLIPEPGLYRVSVSFAGDVSQGFFDSAGEPAVNIEVSFSGQAAQFPASPLLEIPFEGQLGTIGSVKNRIGYGVTAVSENSIPVAEGGGTELPLVAGRGINYAEENDIGVLNWTERGRFMNINADSIKVFNGLPVHIIAGVNGEQSHFGAFYRVVDWDGTAVNPPEGVNFSKWNVIRASPNNCNGFSPNEQIGYDDAASSFSFEGGSDCVSNDTANAYGFWWTHVNAEGKKILMDSLVYVPASSDYSLEHVCDDTAFFAVDGTPGEKLSLRGNDFPLSIEGILGLVKEGKVCVTESGEEFFWNEKEFLKESNASKAADSEWGSRAFGSLEEC